MGHQTVGYKREEELRKILDTTSFRVTRNDCLDLPKSQDINLYCELSASARKMYDQMEEDMVVDIQHIAEEYPRKYLKDICNQMGIEYKRGERYISLLMKTQEYINSSTVDQVITQRIRLQQITGGFITNDVGKVIQIDNSKAQAVKDYLQDYKDPVVIFCKFLPEIQLLQDTFKGSKKKIAVLSGKTKKKDRGKMVKDFQNGKLDMIICQIRAGSVGINLTRSCLTILYSITHSYDDYVQAKSRTDRNGQTRKTLFAHVTCRNSIDEEVLDAVKVKQKRADKMLLKKPFTK